MTSSRLAKRDIQCLVRIQLHGLENDRLQPSTGLHQRSLFHQPVEIANPLDDLAERLFGRILSDLLVDRVHAGRDTMRNRFLISESLSRSWSISDRNRSTSSGVMDSSRVGVRSSSVL